eukprot:EG_transcript_22141
MPRRRYDRALWGNTGPEEHQRKAWHSGTGVGQQQTRRIVAARPQSRSELSDWERKDRDQRQDAGAYAGKEWTRGEGETALTGPGQKKNLKKGSQLTGKAIPLAGEAPPGWPAEAWGRGSP